MDYGRPLEFGYFLDPSGPDFAPALRLAQLADQLALDFIGIQDHPYHRRHFDTWTLLTALATQTSRIRYVPDVANLPLRPPAVLAKAAATLDRITGGRVELALGAGAQWDAIAAMGGPRRTPAEAVAALAEAIDVVRMVWGGERGLRYLGEHYRLDGYNSGPTPAHPMEIWLGAYGPRMLALTGAKADGWLPSTYYFGPDRVAAAQQRIDDAAAAAGRDPAAIRRAYNIVPGLPDWFLAGPPETWVDELTELATEHGIDTFILAPPRDHEQLLHAFAEHVVPAVRDAVAAGRAGSVRTP